MIVVRNMARVDLPNDFALKAMIMGMYSYELRNGGSFQNYMYAAKSGVVYLPPNMQKLRTVAGLLGREIKDERSEGEPLSSPFVLQPEFELREYQKAPTEDLYKHIKQHNYGTLQAGCGTGKTVVMTRVAGQLGRKTLILIDQSNLIENWDAAFGFIWGRSLQQIKSNTAEFGDCCISTFQLFRENPELLNRIRNEFGTLLVDESHVMTAETFRDVMLRLSNINRISCSATFFNKNMPVAVLEDLVAPVCVTMVDPHALTPQVIWVDSGVPWVSDHPDNFASKTLPALAADVRRNTVILGLMKKCLADKRRTIIVAIKKDQAEFLHYMAQKLGAKSVLFTGTTSRKFNQKMKVDFDSGNLDFCVSVMKMNKGTDLESASALIFARPNNNQRDTQQITGRVVRKQEGKPQPIIYDIVDRGSLASRFANNRYKWYLSLGYEVGPVPTFE